MKRLIIVLLVTTISTLGARTAFGQSEAEAAEPSQRRLAWWHEAKLGMFIHWGLYSVLGGEYKGKKSKTPGEGIMLEFKIPKAEYVRYAKDFTCTKFSADEWVNLAQIAFQHLPAIPARAEFKKEAIRVFPVVPASWPDVTIHRLLAEGAFEVSAARRGGQTRWVQIKSFAGAPCIAPVSGESLEKLELLSLELVRPEVKERLHRAALATRAQADAQWFRDARFGLMCHWTSQTVPRSGSPKPCADAARDFDVTKFTEQVAQTGARFVCICTSHAHLYFPAPLKMLDRILPGRTAQRDLVADLANALGKHGIRLMLYYHLGSNDDPPWQAASGFWKTDTSDFWNNWTAVIGEAGERYGDRLAGQQDVVRHPLDDHREVRVEPVHRGRVCLRLLPDGLFQNRPRARLVEN